jgi:type I restriction enzyme S subunit
MSEWKKVKLRDIASAIQTGPFGSQLHQSDYSDIGVPVVMPKDIINGCIDESTIARVESHHVERLSRHKISEGDILYARRGDVGKCAYTVFAQQGWLCGTGCLRVTIDKEKAIPKFIFFQLQKRETIGWVEKHAIGATMLNLNTSILGDVPIELPLLSIQHRIATILSRYDSLIENYQKQIKLLEEAAQRLYKEWFVDLHFPGHENTKIVDGVPEGWEKKKLIEFGCTLESGSRPKGGVDSNLKDGIPSVGAENVIGLGKYNYSSEKLITNQFYSQMRKGKIKNRDILIYKDGVYIGRTSLFQDGFPHKEMAVNEHVFLLHTLNENYQYYVFFTLYQKQYFEKMQKLNKNAAQPGLNQKALLDLGMLCPSEEFVMTFRKAIEPLMKALFNKANQIRLLTEARDRLLPKLMNGEIEV